MTFSLDLPTTPEAFARLDGIQRVALRLQNPEAFDLAEAKAALTKFETRDQLRDFSASQLADFKRIDPERFAALMDGRRVGFSGIRTRADLRSLSPSELVAFKNEDPARYERIVNSR